MPRQRDLVLNPRKVGERFRLAEIDREVWRDALSRIYEALGVKTCRDRVNVTRNILYVLFNYHKARDEGNSPYFWDVYASWIDETPLAKRDKWLRGVAKHADALADLYKAKPKVFTEVILGSDDLEPFGELWVTYVDNLSEIAATARHHLKHRRDPKIRKPDITTGYMLRELHQIYFDKTGKKGKLSRHPKTGKPSGRFFKLVRGVCDLGEINKTCEAIASDIKRWPKERARP